MVVGECHAKISTSQCVLQATFMVVDDTEPTAMDWMALLQFDVSIKQHKFRKSTGCRNIV